MDMHPVECGLVIDGLAEITSEMVEASHETCAPRGRCFSDWRLSEGHRYAAVSQGKRPDGGHWRLVV